ncbi:energy-coupled thiamine transporter ThiT [Amphibacillus sp. Q70]|uniref:energy-coupled thiamine transporter ThiT n=1 Tax=Amphibacillus sp. Q70 TaxID=3453416 RepID=UPI003F82AD86
MQSKRTLFLIEVAVFTALALILDIVPFLSFKIWAQGGSISFAMIPVFIVAYRWGLKGGLLCGFLYGFLQLIMPGAWIAHPIQALLDYPVPFTVLGFAGLFAPAAQAALKQANTKRFIGMVTLGVLLGITLRFISHFIAGVVFFDSVIDGMNTWVYSLVYNSSYLIPSFIINVAAVSFLFNKRPNLIAVTE